MSKTIIDNDFDNDPPVSMIIPGKLWLGCLADAIDEETLKKNGITAILNVSHHKANTDATYKNVWLPLNDGAGNTQEEFDAAVNTLDILMKDGEVVLVHCLAGMSRSASVMATWFAKDTNIIFDEAKDILQKFRSIVMPHYELRKLGRKYLGEADIWFGEEVK